MLLLIGALAALTVSSQQNVFHQAAYAAASADDPNVLIHAFNVAMAQQRFELALQAARRLRLSNPEGKAIAASLEASALLGLKRDAEASALIAKAARLAPSSSEPDRVLFIGAMLAKRPEFAAVALDRLIARAPGVVRKLPRTTLSHFLNHEPQGEELRNEDRVISLARLDYGGDTEVGHELISDAVSILVSRGDFAAAAGLLPDVNQPEYYESMLIQKRYAQLWPQVQTLVGPHLERVRETSIRQVQSAYEKDPNNHEMLQRYINALRSSGRLNEAIQLRTKLPATSVQMASADEPMGWAVNNVALALHEAGRADEADRLFAMLNDASIPNDSWRVSMKINRLDLLMRDGKFDAALALIEATEKANGSAYAKQIVRRMKYCILSSLGRKNEAIKLLPDMLQQADDALGATVDGLVCAGDLDGAEELILRALNHSNAGKRRGFEAYFVRQLQTQPLTASDPPVWQERWLQLRARPRMQEAFNRLGRDMPPHLLPLPSTTSTATR